MRTGTFLAALLIAGGSHALAQASKDSTHAPPPGPITLALDAGLRGFTKEPDPLSIGKFEEYRDLRNGIVVERLLLRYNPADSFSTYSISARNLALLDQSVFLQAKRPGSYDFQLRWDRIPHTYSTTARSPGSEFTPGFNTLPVPRPDSLAWRNAPYIGVIRQQWDPVRASLSVTPNPNSDTQAEYLRIGKSGAIPMGLSFSGSAGPQRDFVAPIDQTIHDVRVSQGYASGARSSDAPWSFVRGYQIMATYVYSRFVNGIKSALVDNPQQSINTFAAGAASGRVSFAPDNAAQTGTVTGGLTLPAHTRITGTALSTWMTQNDLFLPQTSNDSLARDPNFALTTLPRRSLDGHERLSMVNVSATSRPIDRLTLLARYRNFERTDQTAFFHLGALIVSDRTVTPADSETREPDPYTRMNSDFAVTFEAARGLALTGGYMLENWSRDINVRNTAETKEKGPSAAIDYIALDWLALHASHSWTRRRGDQYVISATEITDFRRFDLSDRDRQRTTLIATVTPLAVLDVSLNLRIADDKFPNSLYGTQRDKSIQHDADIAWAATSWLSLSAGYSVEDASNILNMRSRTGAVGSVTDDNPTYRWTNTNNDRNTTAYVGVSAMLIPDKLILTAGYSDIDAHFFVNNVNPITPSGGTAAQNLTATAENWPEVSQNLKPIALALSYRYSPDWAITARFASEQYVNTDFRTSPPLFAPFIGQTGTLPGSIGTVAGSNTGQYHFLGNAYLPYTANWFTLLVTFNPAAIPFVWGRPAL